MEWCRQCRSNGDHLITNCPNLSNDPEARKQQAVHALWERGYADAYLGKPLAEPDNSLYVRGYEAGTYKKTPPMKDEWFSDGDDQYDDD